MKKFRVIKSEEIKVARDQILRTFIKSMEIKVARDQTLRTFIKSVENKVAVIKSVEI
jgi:hypothetical protein